MKKHKCPQCGGSGKLRSIVDYNLFEIWECSVCHGTGEVEIINETRLKNKNTEKWIELPINNSCDNYYKAF